MTRATITLLLCLALASCGGSSGGHRPTVRDDPAFEIGDRGRPYKITYRLDDRSDPDIDASIDDVWVRPPFESRLETSTGDELQSVQIAAIDRLRLGTLTDPLIIARVPGLAVSDLRVRPMLDDAERTGLLEERDQDIVVGRRCQVLRSGTLLGAGPLVPITDDDYADSCIDGDGLLLEETLYSKGTATLHRVATKVDMTPKLTDDQFEVGGFTAAADKGAGSSLPVATTAGALGPFWVLGDDDVPAGFTVVGRYSIVPPQSDRFAVPNNPAIIAGTADVFVRGGDFFVLYQGGTSGRVEAFPPTSGAPAVDGGSLGTGESVLSALGNELHFPRPHGKFVHLIGTLTVDELTAIARDLTETQGTGLVYLD